MSRILSQKYLKERAKTVDFGQSKIIKSIEGPFGKSFNIFKMDWYENEFDDFEQFIEGEL